MEEYYWSFVLPVHQFHCKLAAWIFLPIKAVFLTINIIVSSDCMEMNAAIDQIDTAELKLLAFVFVWTKNLFLCMINWWQFGLFILVSTQCQIIFALGDGSEDLMYYYFLLLLFQ